MVFCHTVFNDALREYPKKTEYQDSAKLLFRYVIEKQSELDHGIFFTITTENIMGRLEDKLPYTQGFQNFQAQMLLVLKNLVMRLPIPAAKTQEESAIIISDLLSSRFDEVILVTNMKKMVQHTLKFYQDAEETSRKWKEKDIPFKIINTIEMEKLIRKNDSGVCTKIDSYTK